MFIYDLLNIEPTELKVHLAADNGRENPLDLYFDGSFKEWQAEQNKRNFQSSGFQTGGSYSIGWSAVKPADYETCCN